MRAFVAVLLLLIAGCAHPPAEDAGDGLSRVHVLRDGDAWTADYRFARDAGAWAFTRSALDRETERPWRPERWQVLTPGVRLERSGNFDLLTSEDGGTVPRDVRIRIAPASVNAVASYDPFLIFSDGSVALYTEQFDAFALPDAEAAEALGFDLRDVAMPARRVAMTFEDRAGPVLHAGKRHRPARAENGADTYMVFGAASPVVTDDMTAVIDPALPAWIDESLRRFIPAVMAHYNDTLGPRDGPHPTVMASWRGPTPGLISAGGSVLPGLVVMNLEGEGLAERSDRALFHFNWFIAHEAAHFWLGQEIRYDSSANAWITEGGADLLAIRAVAALEGGDLWREHVASWIADCIALSEGRGVASARERNEHRAYYACGAIFALVAEAASGGDFSAFARGLIAGNRESGEVGREQWLAALDAASRDPALSDHIGALLDEGAADPAAAIAALFTRAGVPFTLDGEGRPIPL